MKKKIIFGLICCLLIIGLATGCGNNKMSSTNNDDNNNNESNNSNTSKNEKFSNNLDFMGYHIAYPDGADKDWIDNGFLIGTNDDYLLVIETTSILGEGITVSNIEEAPAKCEEQIIHTLENKIRPKFDFGATEKKVKSSNKVTYNGIQMLREDGYFHNSERSKDTNFTAYYLLAPYDSEYKPVYIIGIPMNDTFEIGTFVDTIAKNITR